MNAGFANLTTLKRHLLAERLRPEITFDDQVLAVGLGVAGAIERYCDRKFGRVVGDTWETPSADRLTFVLPRYPVEAITAIDLRGSYGEAWQSQDPDELLLQVVSDSGIVTFDVAIGWRGSVVRFTYTAGYWWDTTEDDTGELPTGATELPADLRHAWLLQCEEIWSRRDNLGVGLTSKPTERAKLGELDVSPAVRSLLRPHIRHAS